MSNMDVQYRLLRTGTDCHRAPTSVRTSGMYWICCYQPGFQKRWTSICPLHLLDEVRPVFQHGPQRICFQDTMDSEQCPLALWCHHTKIRDFAQWTDRTTPVVASLEALDQSHLQREKKLDELDTWKKWLSDRVFIIALWSLLVPTSFLFYCCKPTTTRNARAVTITFRRISDHWQIHRAKPEWNSCSTSQYRKPCF